LQRRPVPLRAIFTAHGPIKIVRRTVPRESTAKNLLGHEFRRHAYSCRQLFANAAIAASRVGS